MKDDEWVKTQFVAAVGGAKFLSSAKVAAYGNNALQLGVFWEAFKIDTAVRAITVDRAGRQWGWKDVCYVNYDGSCRYDGPLNHWSMNFTTYLQQVGGNAANASQGDRRALIAAVNQFRFPDNQSVSTLSIFGGITLSPSGTTPPLYMSSAKVISFGYSFRDGLPSSVTKEWYKQFLAIAKAWAADATHSSIAYIAGNSVDNEIGRSVTADLYLIVIAVTIFNLVAVLGMSRTHAVATRSTLGLIGVASGGLGLLAGYGLSMAIGMPFTTLQQTLPYILLGLAVDCMFILSKAYDEICNDRPGASLAERFHELGRGAGLSVVVTLLASAVAFALGTITPLPSIRWFSVYATLCVLAIMVTTLTFFTAVFVITEKRIRANRLDLLCCLARPGAPPPLAAPPDELPPPLAVPITVQPARSASAGSTASRTSSSTGSVGHAKFTEEMPPAAPPATAEKAPNLVKALFKHYYCPFITSWWGKALVLSAFIGYTVMTGIGTSRLGYGQPLSDLAPDDSYLQAYVSVIEDTFQQQVGSPTNLYFRGLDPASPAVQAKMLQTMDKVLADPYINATLSAFQDNWLLSFIQFVESSHPEVVLLALAGCTNPLMGRPTGDLSHFVQPTQIGGCVPQTSFYALLQEFLAHSPGFKNDLAFSGSAVQTSRMTVVHTAQGDDGAYGRRALRSIRAVEEYANQEIFAAESAAAGRSIVLMFQGDYVFWEGDAILGHMAMEYVLLAVGGVGLVLLLLLPSPRVVLLMMVSVGLVDFFLFGEMFMFGIRFNQVSIINMIMATGLAVDYSVYFALRFVTIQADGTRNGRVAAALADTGSAVFLGGVTALMGTIPLAFASSAILRTFFALLFGTIIYSLLVGLVLMPVLLSLLGPPPPPQGGSSGSSNGVSASPAIAKGDGDASPGPPGATKTAWQDAPV